MKKHLLLLFIAIACQAFSQTYPITGINIILSGDPDPNIANWANASSLFMISASAKTDKGRVDNLVMDSKILVTISGANACGSYTKENAPDSNFNTPTKMWRGEAAVSLFGESCVLPPGNYEICVQFFVEGAVGLMPLSDKKCKSFFIKETEHQTYQSPQLLAPADGTEFSDTDLKRPMTFRWLPVLPKPQDPVTYRLTVWQLLQGQTGTQAMRVNQPIIEKDVDNMTQIVVNNLIDGPCKLPYLCDFAWNVQALNRKGKPIGENKGLSKPFEFSVHSCDVNLALELISIECLKPTHGFNNYKICASSTYTSSNTDLTYSDANSGFKVYPPSYSPYYPVSNITPALQTQNSGSTTTVNYCFNVSVPTGQISIKVGLQGDDKNSGPLVCQPGAELNLRLPDCTNPTCECGSWSPLTVLDAAQGKRYDCGSTIEWTCKQALNFTASYQCSPDDKTCQAKTEWKVENSSGVLVKYGTGTNQLSDGFSLLENGTYTLTLNASCNGKVCPPCTYTIIIRDCKTCDCGSWDTLIVNRVKYECNNEKPIKWTCNKPIEFSNTYQCSPNDDTCQAKTKWEVKKDGQSFSSGNGSNGTFTPTANGTYTLTLHANCNGKDCKDCVTTFIVEDCSSCGCGEWSDFPITIQTGGAIISRVKCEGSASLGIGTYSIQYPNYICTTNNDSCLASYLWSVQGPVSGNGIGNFINFNFSQTGTYTVTVIPLCGGKRCKPCKIVIKIEDPLPCNLSFVDNLKDDYCVGDPITINWTGSTNPSTVNLVLIDFTNWTSFQIIAANIPNTGSYTWTLPANLPCDPERKWCFYVTDPALSPQCWNYSKEFTIGCCIEKPCDCGNWSTLRVNRKRYECGNEKPIKWRCNKPIKFSNTYQCSPNDDTCQAETKWEVKKDGQSFSSGNGSNGTFTPTANGTYTLTLHANCNGKECKDCVTTFIVEDCRCDCGEWGQLNVLTAAGNKTYTCGIKMYIPWSCKQPFNFTNTYQCSPNNASCQANTTWKVEKDNHLINSGTGTNSLNGTFTPTENGIYTITLESSCNGVKCKPCIYQVKVTDCCQASEIIIKKGKNTIPNDDSCIKSGPYSFNLNITPSIPSVSGTYVLTSTPNNTTVSSGNFISGVPLNLIIPKYVCGLVTGFKLTYTWNHGKCSSTIERTICPPPCCDNISVGKTSLNLNGTDLNFITEFLIAAPPVTFSKVKAQILDIDGNGGAKPWANILSINETSLGAGNTNAAIITQGDAIWYPGPLAPVTTSSLTFKGKIIKFYSPQNPINLIVRFTFYQDNGTCDEIICEKDINYNIVTGPKK